MREFLVSILVACALFALSFGALFLGLRTRARRCSASCAGCERPELEKEA